MDKDQLLKTVEVGLKVAKYLWKGREQKTLTPSYWYFQIGRSVGALTVHEDKTVEWKSDDHRYAFKIPFLKAKFYPTVMQMYSAIEILEMDSFRFVADIEATKNRMEDEIVRKYTRAAEQAIEYEILPD